jgi:hypothetical protein
VRTNRVTLPGSAAPVVPRAGAVATCNWLVGGPASAHPGKAVAAHPGLTP